MRKESINRLLDAVPILRQEGWVLTPYSAHVADDGAVALVFRTEDGAARDLVARLRELQPDLVVQLKVDPAARHVIVKL